MSSISEGGGRKNTLPPLRFDDGAVQFRQRICVSLLSGRPILIRNIRHEDISELGPGLRLHEASFLRLIDSLTNGTRIEINGTGTQIRFVPGILAGGSVEHDCPVVREGEEGEGGDQGDSAVGEDDGSSLLTSRCRSVGWFLEGILPLAPFGKEPLRVLFTGATDGCCDVDPSPDYLKATALPLMALFGIGTDAGDRDFLSPETPHIHISRRGAAPAGGGRVELYCPIVPKELRPIDFVDPGKVKRIRGDSISTKIISSSSAARAAYTAKGVFHKLLPDVWIHTDCHNVKRHQCGPCPSLSLVLKAETTTGCVLASECTLQQHQSSKRFDGHRPPTAATRELPEDLGRRGACQLLEEVRRGGCVDTGAQPLALLWMCVTPEDVSRVRFGTLSQHAVETLRLLKLAFGVEFKIRPDPETKTVLLSCLGTGYRNMARAST